MMASFMYIYHVPTFELFEMQRLVNLLTTDIVFATNLSNMICFVTVKVNFKTPVKNRGITAA